MALRVLVAISCSPARRPSPVAARRRAGPRTGPGAPPVRFGTKNFTEQFVLGRLHAQTLRARGFAVELKQDLGSSSTSTRR